MRSVDCRGGGWFVGRGAGVGFGRGAGGGEWGAPEGAGGGVAGVVCQRYGDAADVGAAGSIVISAGEEKWKNQTEVFADAAGFQKAGGKLVRLEFPRTDVQRFGDVAILWSDFLFETDVAGKR
jgi:hypothetical protein